MFGGVALPWVSEKERERSLGAVRWGCERTGGGGRGAKKASKREKKVTTTSATAQIARGGFRREEIVRRKNLLLLFLVSLYCVERGFDGEDFQWYLRT